MPLRADCFRLRRRRPRFAKQRQTREAEAPNRMTPAPGPLCKQHFPASLGRKCVGRPEVGGGKIKTVRRHLHRSRSIWPSGTSGATCQLLSCALRLALGGRRLREPPAGPTLPPGSAKVPLATGPLGSGPEGSTRTRDVGGRGGGEVLKSKVDLEHGGEHRTGKYSNIRPPASPTWRKAAGTSVVGATASQRERERQI